jgi:valyl-tRNA synthetase
LAGELRDVSSQFTHLSRAVLQGVGLDVSRPGTSAAFSIGDADAYIPLAGVIDREAELTRQTKEAEKIRGFIVGHERKLSNESFVAKAPPEVVEQVRETLAGLRKQLQGVEEAIRQLTAEG